MKWLDPSNPPSSAKLSTAALTLWAVFFLLSYLGGRLPETIASHIVLIIALIIGVVAIGLTIFAIYHCVREQLNKNK